MPGENQTQQLPELSVNEAKLITNISDTDSVKRLNDLVLENENLKKDIEKQKAELDKGLIEIEKTKNITYLGFIILLVMVATLVITFFWQQITSYNSLLERVILIQTELNAKR